jgi:hypothetical protein
MLNNSSKKMAGAAAVHAHRGNMVAQISNMISQGAMLRMVEKGPLDEADIEQIFRGVRRDVITIPEIPEIPEMYRDQMLDLVGQVEKNMMGMAAIRAETVRKD